MLEINLREAKIRKMRLSANGVNYLNLQKNMMIDIVKKLSFFLYTEICLQFMQVI